MRDGFDAAEIIFESEMFVGSVRVFVGEAETDEHAGDFKGVMHLRNEGDRAAFANEGCFFSEAFFEGGLSDLKNGRVERSYPGFAGAEYFEFAFNGLGQKFANVFLYEFCDNVRILVGNEPRGEFCIGFRGNDRFGAFALIAAPNAVQFESGPRPKLLDNCKTFFAEIARRANGFLECFFFPGQRVQRFAFDCGNFCDFVVEAGDGDSKFLVVELGEQLSKNSKGIRDCTAVYAGVEIARWTSEFDLVIIQSAQTVGDRGHALREHRCVGYNKRIGLQLFFIFLHVIPQADAADFFLAFDQDFYVDGELAVHFLDGFERLQMDVNLALVVGGAAAEEISIAHGRFERGRSPKIERLGGLDVVVAVKKDGGFAGSFEGFGIDERMKICRNDFDFLEAATAKIISHPAGGAFDIRLVFTFGAHTGDSQEFAKLRQMLVAITFYEFSKVRHGAPGGNESFQKNSS